MELVDGRFWCSARRQDAIPVVLLVTLERCFGDRRNVRGNDGALCTRNTERTQLSRFYLCHRREDVREVKIDLAADQIDERRCTALVGHMNELHFGEVLEEFAGEMRRAADPS